jgi:hypothetical protein
MTEATMGALLRSIEVARVTVRDAAPAEVEAQRRPDGWNPENFAREQIRGLVRQVFFANAARPARQVVFAAVDPETDVRGLCRRVGESLAMETQETVAVMGKYPRLLHRAEAVHEELPDRGSNDGMPLRQLGTRARANLWLVPEKDGGSDCFTSAGLHSYLGELRRQFEHSIVQSPSAGESDAATAMALFADGIILVLSAQRTRRATARKIKLALEAAQVRILGVVLSDREFPIPEAIYRRL